MLVELSSPDSEVVLWPFMCICNWNSFIKVCPFPYLFLVNNIDQKYHGLDMSEKLDESI